MRKLTKVQRQVVEALKEPGAYLCESWESNSMTPTIHVVQEDCFGDLSVMFPVNIRTFDSLKKHQHILWAKTTKLYDVQQAK